MSPPATIRDVARAAQLSVASVSRVLNARTGVNADTRERVLAAVASLGYVPNAAARSLSTARSHALGVVLPDLHGEFFSEMVRGMDSAASARGYLLLLSNMHADRLLAGQALGAMRGRVDGLIVMAPQLSAADRERVLPGGLPTVLVNSPQESGHPALRVDNAAGTRAMMRHLVASGRRRIVHIAGFAGNMDGAERMTAYCAALAEFAPGVAPRVIAGDFTDASGEKAVRTLLAEGAEFDAVFAANDMMALGALQALRQSGIAVPQAVAVCGFDDVPLARYLGLTTMRVDMVGIGARAVERVIAEIELQAGDIALERSVPQLVVRATTDAAA